MSKFATEIARYTENYSGNTIRRSTLSVCQFLKSHGPRSDSDIEFLSDTIAVVEYDYELRLSQIPTPERRFEMLYSSGNMAIVSERRKNPERINEWRILEWYDYATPK